MGTTTGLGAHRGAVRFERTFTGAKAFGAINAARSWLKDRGYSVGSMCGKEPMGIRIGDHAIHKWRNLHPSEKAALDGTIESENFRDGPVVVRLKSKPAGEE